MKLDFEFKIHDKAIDPLPMQKAFLESPAKYRCYAGGFGSGKSVIGCMESIILLLSHPGVVGLVTRATMPELKSTTMVSFFELLGTNYDNAEQCPLIKKFNRSEGRLVLINNSTTYFLSLENLDKIKSLNLTFAYIDELTEVSHTLWNMLLGRLRNLTGRRCLFGTTNPEGKDWVYDLFFDTDSFHQNHQGFVSPTTENYHLPKDYVQSLKKNYPEEWIKRYVYASFDEASGIIYKSFSRSIHVIEPFDIPDHWPTFVAYDYGYTNPFCALLSSVDEFGNIFVRNGLYQSYLKISDQAEMIHWMKGNIKIDAYPADPSCFKHDKDGQSVASIFQDPEICGKFTIDLIPARNDIRAGIDRVNWYLGYDKKKEVATGEYDIKKREWLWSSKNHPKVLFFDGDWIDDFYKEIENYKWKKLRANQRNKSQPEEPVDYNDHYMDTLKYKLQHIYNAITPQQEIPAWKRRWIERDKKRRSKRTQHWMAA